ncbi:FAD-binding oxidoreductase [Phycicoccus sp. MAQZ13P-2]|uniref:FAD-binding oxidoreductase n=1 Tax=Phycicoccus mangrovi TaxID=2840470 RepID=UPI001C008C74|nr:FAD-binding oxidoreductase [Phycicoccus mangrovi]MBT9256449.1 FAD-binding oxidoreductase [Phycicoccus mangrovi]MBT9275098.1 FAD-binding oxidoreductase [Phycicoccus mangrovi]
MTWLDDLDAAISGDVSTPGARYWDHHRAAWNVAVDQRPLAVARPDTPEDVREVVTAAARAGVRVAPQSTGHNAAPLGDLSDTVLLRTDRMRGVAVDPTTRTARVEAGALWGDVTEAAATHGLAALAGSAADVGVTGYTLSGGLSWFARSHGLAADHLVAAEVVTADGELRRVDAATGPDLFEALRGGGNGIAVVTALEFRLFPVREAVAGALFFPLEAASRVFAAWSRWTRTVPDEVTSVCRVLRFPPLPDLPPHLAGRAFTVVELCSTLDAATTEALVAGLRAHHPLMDTVTTTPVEQLHLLHMDPPGPVPAAGDGIVLGDLPAEALDAMLRQVGPAAETPLLSVELRHLGGALTPGAKCGPGASRGIAGSYLCFAVGITPTPEAGVAVRAAVDSLVDALSPWAGEGRLPGFVEHAATPEAVYGDALERLREVKRRYDPTDLVRANHPLLERSSRPTDRVPRVLEGAPA